MEEEKEEEEAEEEERGSRRRRRGDPIFHGLPTCTVLADVRVLLKLHTFWLDRLVGSATTT